MEAAACRNPQCAVDGKFTEAEMAADVLAHGRLVIFSPDALWHRSGMVIEV